MRFQTEDNVWLAADWLPASSPGRPAAILLHMVPPRNNRTGYPTRVLEALAALDFGVLNVDRRGAGESDGNPEEAHRGPGGAHDVRAAVSFVTTNASSCTADPARLALIGASNGTTAILDYVASHAVGDPDPWKIAWLAPGTYTENQHTVVSVRDRLTAIPMLWAYSDAEPWSRTFAAGAPPSWQFLELTGGEHGTRNFNGTEYESRLLSAIINLLAH